MALVMVYNPPPRRLLSLCLHSQALFLMLPIIAGDDVFCVLVRANTGIGVETPQLSELSVEALNHRAC